MKVIKTARNCSSEFDGLPACILALIVKRAMRYELDINVHTYTASSYGFIECYNCPTDEGNTREVVDVYDCDSPGSSPRSSHCNCFHYQISEPDRGVREKFDYVFMLFARGPRDQNMISEVYAALLYDYQKSVRKHSQEYSIVLPRNG